ncbi:hypothetical protein V8C35DRAFT_56517 [Trichoderma chlorosporum]
MFYESLYVHDAKMAAHQPMPHRAATKATARNFVLKPPSQRPKPLDADDLTRRLYVVLAEQKASAERKKRARAAVEAERQANAAAVARNANALHPGQHGIPLGPTVASTQIQKKEATAATAAKSHVKVGPRDSNEHPHKAEKLHKAGMKNSTSSSSNRNSEDTPPSNYRHIPQVAASQFARTTTTETVTEKHLVHKLSRQAVKFHMQGPNAMVSSDLAPSEQNKALRRVQSMRERQYERNQFQHTHTLTTTTEVDEKLAAAAPHTFQEYLRSRSPDPLDVANKEMRRRSVGAILGMMAPPDAESAERSMSSFENQSDTLPANPDEHRVDWTQSDEAVTLLQQRQQQQQSHQQPQQPPPQKSTAGQNVLRKAESKWALRTRLGSFSKKGDKLSSPTEDKDTEPLTETPKSPTKTGGLFARFKR